MALKRGVATRRLQVVGQLRGLLRQDVTADRMLRSVASLLAREVADYCIADVLGKRGAMERIAIEHADPSMRTQLQVAAEVTVLAPQGRVGRLLARGGTERVGRLTETSRTRALADVDLRGPPLRSYMAATVSVGGTPLGVLSLISTTKGRQFSEDELEFLSALADWTGLGLENALRRELHPRTTLGPSQTSIGPSRISLGPPASQTIPSPARRTAMARSG